MGEAVLAGKGMAPVTQPQAAREQGTYALICCLLTESPADALHWPNPTKGQGQWSLEIWGRSQAEKDGNRSEG